MLVEAQAPAGSRQFETVPVAAQANAAGSMTTEALGRRPRLTASFRSPVPSACTTSTAATIPTRVYPVPAAATKRWLAISFLALMHPAADEVAAERRSAADAEGISIATHSVTRNGWVAMRNSLWPSSRNDVQGQIICRSVTRNGLASIRDPSVYDLRAAGVSAGGRSAIRSVNGAR